MLRKSEEIHFAMDPLKGPVMIDMDNNVHEIAANKDVIDPWSLPELRVTGPRWRERSTKSKIKYVVLACARVMLLILLIYIFICGLSTMSDGFKLLGGRTMGKIFHESVILSNPIAKVMIGCLSTAIIQSSSVTTSMVVAIVNANIVKVADAVYLIMGANIGTTVTSSVVAFMQAGSREEFRRAFAAATLDDTFNWMSVIIMLPLEIITKQIFGKGYLEAISYACIPTNYTGHGVQSEPEFLQAVIKPITSRIVQVDKYVINEISLNETAAAGKTIAKRFCKDSAGNVTKCDWLFNISSLNDVETGAIVVALSMLVLWIALWCIVKTLHALSKGAMLKTLRKVVNLECPSPVRFLTDYCLMAVGAVLTFIMQGSHVFLCTITPLAGLGVIPIQKFYAMQNGADLGTTKTALIAALVLSDDGTALQIALCHFFFNITSILIFFVIPFMRWPVVVSKMLGNIVYDYRWFSVVIVIMFFLIPLIFIGLSLIHWGVAVGIAIPAFVLLASVVTINHWQTAHPKWLPQRLRNWDFLPYYLRSLQPYDRIMSKVVSVCACCCRQRQDKVGQEASHAVTLAAK